MDKNRNREREQEPEHDENDENATRRGVDEADGRVDTFNPRSGEDPGLLELTEDPRERRLKRHTM